MKTSFSPLASGQRPAAAPTTAHQARTLKTDIDSSPRMLALRRVLEAALPPTPPRQEARPNDTGMPDALKSGVESLAGMDLSDVRVHRNSSRPAQLAAHAYAQGNEIHLAPGQEHHLPHEAWHVVQQRQGRVRPTAQLAGVAVNDDRVLEHEADVMGAQALQHAPDRVGTSPLQRVSAQPGAPVQRSGTGALVGTVVGAGIGALGFFAGPLGGITTAIGAIVGGIVGHVMTRGPLPSGAHARKDKTLSPVNTTELDDILAQAERTPERMKHLIKQTGDRLIDQGLLFWTVGGREHCEVIVDDQDEDRYRVRVIVVMPRRPPRDETDAGVQYGAAIHELIHAIEVVSRIGGVENLGVEIPKVRDEDTGKVLRGNELQWSKVPEADTTQMVDTLTQELEALIVREEQSKAVSRRKLDFLWSHYQERLGYARKYRHEVPTVIVQIIENIHKLGDEDQVEDSDFYRSLIEARQRLMDAL